MNSFPQLPTMKPLIFCPIFILALLAGTVIAQPPKPDEEPIDAHLPLVSQEDSPIQFNVKFWPTHILAGERVNMELTLRNVGTEPFRIPKAVPDVYELRVNLYLDHRQFGPLHRELNVFHSVPLNGMDRAWERINESDTIMPGDTYTITSNHIFAEAGGSTGATGRINQLETARIRTVIYLDDGNFIPDDWVEFTIEQPDPREEDWRDDITVETKDPFTGEMRTFRSGLLQQRVAGVPHWFIAFQGQATLGLTRLPIQHIRQVIQRRHRDDGSMTSLAVLGTSESGEWFVYHPTRERHGEHIRSLGSDKHWRFHVTDDGQVKVLEADSR